MPSTALINKWCSDIKDAVERNDKKTIEYLVEDASVSVEYLNPLLLALLVDDAPILYTIICSIVQVKGITNDKLASILVQAQCPITHIVFICNTEVIERMIKKGADINYRDKERGFTALHMAAFTEDLQLADILLQHGAQVDIMCQGGETPLHKAVIVNNFGMVERLLSKGADINSRNNSNFTPLHSAFHFHIQRDHIIWLLIHKGADLTARDAFGVTPLHLASDFPEVIEYILSSGMDVSVKDFDKGRTALHFIMERIGSDISISNRQIKSITALVRHGADINDRNNDGCTPLHCAIEALKYSKVEVDRVSPIKEILQFCFEHGADVNGKNGKSETVLRVAADDSSIWVKTILEHIAKLELQGLPIDDCNIDIIRSNSSYRLYYHLCKSELLTMKDEKCYGNISLFNLLTDNAKKMIDYARNHDIMEYCVGNCYYNGFPIYCKYLSNRVDRAVKRQKLMYDTAKFLSSVLKFINPRDVIMDKILYYLDESDMRKLIGNYYVH